MAVVKQKMICPPATKIGQGLKWLVAKGILWSRHSASHSGCGNPSWDVPIKGIFLPIASKSITCVYVPSHSLDHYADDVNAQTPHPPIPAEALARRAHLQTVLRDMEGRGRSLEPSSMQALRAVMAGDNAPDL